MGNKEIDVNVASLFGYNDRKGYVEFSLGETKMQITPNKAKEIGMMLFEAAEAAECDEYIGTYFKDKVGMDDKQLSVLLNDFRSHRLVMSAQQKAFDDGNG